MTDYEKYQLEWMISHRYSIRDLIHELNEYSKDGEPGDSIEDVFLNWELDSGFGGSIWACEREWEDEYVDPSTLNAIEDCDELVHEMDIPEAKLYEENGDFKLEVAKRYKDYWFDYLATFGDDRWDYVETALEDTYNEWKEEGKIQ